MKPDPWADIAAASGASAFSARRADPSHPYDFFWGRDVEGRRLLAMLYAPLSATADPRPKLNGIEIIETEGNSGEKAALILALKQPDAAEIFLDLCRSIMTAAGNCASEKAALSAAIKCAWKWHSLLRSGGAGRLTEAEQQGLFGELVILSELADRHGPSAALAFWRGPLGEPKDFVIGASAIEVKTRQSGKAAVEITSEHQLDPAGLDRLTLSVFHISPAAPSAPGALSLDAKIAEVRGRLSATPGATEQFDVLLSAAGWSETEGYAEPCWLRLGVQHFDASGDFPRISASGLAAGIGGVRYRLNLDACAGFEVSEEDALATVEKI